jgi:phosphate transport system substrate-binding protein
MKKSLMYASAIVMMMTIPAHSRDQVQVAGSSTVLPYANIVAEEFGKIWSGSTPIIESGGSSAGLKLFCKGTGFDSIDVANSSRKIRDSELKVCASNGVKDVREFRFGYDGIVFATDISGPAFALQPRHMYLALNSRSKLKTWNQVDVTFPSWEIEVYIPGEKHGTREVFEDKVLIEGCKQVGDFDKFMAEHDDKKKAESLCKAVRKDGASVDINGDYTETLGRLAANKTGMGVFGLAFYENNTDKLRVATVNGVTPTMETVATGEYPVSRPLFFYVKGEHLSVVPGLKEYVKFFISERMIGEDGPLVEYGLVPLSEKEFTELQTRLE